MDTEKDQLALTWPVETSLLNKRRSCDLTEKISPCIEKAATHLYELEDRLAAIRNEIQKNKSSEVKQSPRADISPAAPADTLHSNWLVTKEPVSPRQQSIISASGAILEIHGAGFMKLSQDPQIHEKPSSLPKFGDQIIKDTLLLLGRLETDRVNTAQSLVLQKQRVKQLRTKIDEYAHRRLYFLPIAVQKEHESCVFNIQELKWHLSFTGRRAERMRENVKTAETINKTLKEELRYIQEHSPWVEAKVDDERDQMVEIQKHQNTTDTELGGALEMVESLEKKYTNADKVADYERKKLDKEVGDVRDQLNNATDELSRFKMQFTSYVHSLNDSKNRLKELAEEAEVCDTRLLRALQSQKRQEEKVELLIKKIKEQEEEKLKLIEENAKLRIERNEQQVELETQTAKLELDNRKQTQKLRELIAADRNLEREIRNLLRSITDVGKRKTESQKMAKRGLVEMQKVSDEAELLADEIAKVQLVHDKLEVTLAKDREKCEKIEEDLKTTADSLKKQLKDEAHARTVLQARIAADTLDYLKTKSEAGKKKEKGTKRASEIEKAVTKLRSQIEKMDNSHEERLKVIAELNAFLEKVRNQHSQTERKSKDEIDRLKPKEDSLKVESTGLSRRIDEMDWRTEAIERRMQDMAQSSVMMNRVLLSTQEAIEELSEELNELTIQLESGQGITETLETTLKQLRARSSKGTEDHQIHMNARERSLKGLQVGLQKALEKNKALAKGYTSIQNTHLVEKDKLLNVYEIAVLSQNTLKDKKELCDFQARIHQALQSYYKLRGVKTRAGILRFEELTGQNGERLVKIKGDLKGTLENITEFLETNNKAHEAIRAQAVETARSVVGVSA